MVEPNEVKASSIGRPGGSAAASGVSQQHHGSNQSSRKTNVKSQGNKFRGGDSTTTEQPQNKQESENNKNGTTGSKGAGQYTKLSSDLQKNVRSLRGVSEQSAQRHSDLEGGKKSKGGGDHPDLNESATNNDRMSAGAAAFDPAKLTVSSKSNAFSNQGKKEGGSGHVQAQGITGKVVTKKKKSKVAGNSGSVVNATNSASRDNSVNKTMNKTTKRISGVNNTTSETIGIQPREGTSPKKSTSSVSNRQNRQQQPKTGRTSSFSGKLPAGGEGSINNSEASKSKIRNKSPNQSMAMEKIMKSSMKSGQMGQETDNNTVSNWRDSQSESHRMMASTGAIQAQDNPVLGKLKEPDEKAKDKMQPLNITAASGQEQIDGQNEDDDNAAENQPASPASKAPQLNLLQVQPQVDLDTQGSIDELSNENPSPVSAGPIMHSQFRNEQNNSTFGIKLLQLEVTSNMSVGKIGEHTIEESKQSIRASPERPSLTLDSPVNRLGDERGSPSPNGIETQSEADGTAVRPELTAPLPILPKVTTVIHMPVKCPIENIRFVNLKRFLAFQKQAVEQMSAGYDLVGQRRKMIQLKTEDKIKKGGNGIEGLDQLAKIDDTTHFIKSIIYARDPKIIDQEKGHVHQREAFSHLNNLDVKMLVAKSQLMGEEAKYPSLSPRAARRLPREDNNNRPVLDSQVYKLKAPDDPTLLFESRFESGNLYLAQKVSDGEYNLLMSNDVNTQGHTQWFFFQVRNTRAKQKVKFNILNYSKPDSLFNYGMKISVYSDKKSEKKNIGWHKDCEDIRYFINGIRKDVTYYSKSYYTATFTYTFEYDEDIVYFAYSVPYTYSDLRNDIATIEQDQHRSKFVRKSTLCRTLSGEACELLTITSADNLDNFRSRKGIVITARVHPGETVGSWMMRGVLTFLTDPDNIEARMLRENFVFKVIPMLNPDGVINGNYRCSLAGCDLNRRWKTPNKTLHPTIFHTKRLVKQIHQERGLVLFCDLHGHSRKQNVFMYGCNNKQNPGECRIFPFILSKMNQFFCYEYSRFGVQKSKEQTARVSLYKELKNVPNIYTMESSFAGCDMGPSAGKHLTCDMLETLGHDCCRAILIYCNLYVPPELADQPFFKNILLAQQAAKKKSANDLGKKKFKEPAPLNMKDAIMGEINNNKELLQQEGGDESSSGSDSAPSEDNMQAEELIKQLPTADKTLKLQIKKNQEKKKADEAQQAQSQVKLRRQSSGKNLKKEEPPKRQMSPLKRPAQAADKKEEVKPEEKKKPKVETRDACTQTDRSDYQLIKQKMLKERKIKEEQAAMLQQQQARTQGVSSDRQLINDLNQRPQDYVPGAPQQLNTTQRLQQMVALSDAKSRANAHKMPLSQNYNQNPLKKMPGTVSNHHPFIKGGVVSGQHPNSTRNATGAMPPNNQKIMIPDKNKYNFMGVSTIKQGQNQGQLQVQNGPNNDNSNEYGTSVPNMQSPGIRPPHGANMAQQKPNQSIVSPVKPGTIIPSPQILSNTSQSLQQYQEQIKVTNPLQNQRTHPQVPMKNDLDFNSNKIKIDSRQSNKRQASGGNSEQVPGMQTLMSANTNNSLREQSQFKPVMGSTQHQNNMLVLGRQNNSQKLQQKGQNNYTLAQRSQNFGDNEIISQRQPQMLSPQNTTAVQPQYMLPQTKQLPQKEFIMMDVGASGGPRKGSRNPNLKHQNTPASNQIGSLHQNNLAFQKAKSQFNSQNPAASNYPVQQTVQQPQHVSRFNSQRPQQLVETKEQTLARNNSTHCRTTTNGQFAGPLGTSPMRKDGQNLKSGMNARDADQYTAQLQEMSLSQSLGHNTNVGPKISGQPPNIVVSSMSPADVNNSQSGFIGNDQQPLRSSLNASQTPGKPSQNWQQNFQTEGSASHGYKPVSGTSILPQQSSMVHSQLEHAEHCGKLPVLNVRNPAKTGRNDSKSFQYPNGSHNHFNGSGVIGGLNIVLNSGQGTISTPSQKKTFSVGQHSKFQTQAVQPQLIGTSMHIVSQGGNPSGANPVQSSHIKQPSATSLSRQQANWQTQNDSGANQNQSQVTAGGLTAGQGPDFSNNTSSATHKRNTRGAVYSMGGGTTSGIQQQNTSDQKLHQMMQSGARTPSQNETRNINRPNGSEFLPQGSRNNSNQVHHNLNSPSNNIGSISLEGEQLQDLEGNKSPLLRPGAQKGGSVKPKAGSMVTRLRNQSEIADTRNNQNNYGTYDARGPNPRQSKYGGPNTGVTSNTDQMLTPQMNYSKRSIISNNSQGKVVGKRYSRH